MYVCMYVYYIYIYTHMEWLARETKPNDIVACKNDRQRDPTAHSCARKSTPSFHFQHLTFECRPGVSFL